MLHAFFNVSGTRKIGENLGDLFRLIIENDLALGSRGALHIATFNAVDHASKRRDLKIRPLSERLLGIE